MVLRRFVCNKSYIVLAIPQHNQAPSTDDKRFVTCEVQVLSR